MDNLELDNVIIGDTEFEIIYRINRGLPSNDYDVPDDPDEIDIQEVNLVVDDDNGNKISVPFDESIADIFRACNDKHDFYSLIESKIEIY